MRVDGLRLARFLTALAVLAALADLIVGRGVLFLRHERIRVGLPPLGGVLGDAVPYVTTLAGLVAAAAVAALGAFLATARAGAVARALGAGFSTAVVSLGLATTVFPPGVRGILTIHMTAAVGGLMLAGVVLASRAPGDLKLLVAVPLALPPIAAVSAVLRDGGLASAVLRGVVVAVAFTAAATAAVVVVRRHRVSAPLAIRGGILAGLLAGSVFAATAEHQPWRLVEFLLLSHGIPLDFRGGLALAAVVVSATTFAAAVFLMAPRRSDPAEAARPLIGWGLALGLLAGPGPTSASQAMMLAAASLALAAGAAERMPSPPGVVETMPDPARVSSPR